MLFLKVCMLTHQCTGCVYLFSEWMPLMQTRCLLPMFDLLPEYDLLKMQISSKQSGLGNQTEHMPTFWWKGVGDGILTWEINFMLVYLFNLVSTMSGYMISLLCFYASPNLLPANDKRERITNPCKQHHMAAYQAPPLNQARGNKIEIWVLKWIMLNQCLKVKIDFHRHLA